MILYNSLNMENCDFMLAFREKLMYSIDILIEKHLEYPPYLTSFTSVRSCKNLICAGDFRAFVSSSAGIRSVGI